MGPLANPSADGPASWVGPTWLDGAAVGSGAIGTCFMLGLLQLTAAELRRRQTGSRRLAWFLLDGGTVTMYLKK